MFVIPCKSFQVPSRCLCYPCWGMSMEWWLYDHTPQVRQATYGDHRFSPELLSSPREPWVSVLFAQTHLFLLHSVQTQLQRLRIIFQARMGLQANIKLRMQSRTVRCETFCKRLASSIISYSHAGVKNDQRVHCIIPSLETVDINNRLMS